MNAYPSYYSIIPANVRYCKALEPNAKLLYGEITALANMHGYCWATNKYFAELYDVDERTIQRWLESLKQSEFIEIETSKNGIYWQRKIWISQEIKEMFTKGQKCQGGVTNMSGGGDKNVQPIPYNTTQNNTLEKQQQQPPPVVVLLKNKPDKTTASTVDHIYPKLSVLDIPHQDKVWLTKNYEESTVIQAVAFATHPKTSITTTLAQTIKWACKEQPQIPKDEHVISDENKRVAEAFLKKAVIPEQSYLEILHKYVEIGGIGQSDPVTISYDHPQFKERFLNALRKHNIKQKSYEKDPKL